MFRGPGERCNENCISPRVQFGGMLVVRGNSLEVPTVLVNFPSGSLNVGGFIRGYFEDQMVPFAPFVGEYFLFMQDKSRLHTASLTHQYVHDVGIRLLE